MAFNNWSLSSNQMSSASNSSVSFVTVWSLLPLNVLLNKLTTTKNISLTHSKSIQHYISVVNGTLKAIMSEESVDQTFS